MFDNYNIFLTITCCIITLCILCNHDLQYLIIYYVFSEIAPVEEDDPNKHKSDYLYDLKKRYEIKKTNDTLNQRHCILNQITTFRYQDIKDKLDAEYFKTITDSHTKPVLIKQIFSQNELKQYDLNNMLKHYGNIVVSAVKIDALNRRKTKDSKNNRKHIKVPFKEYVRRMRNGEKYYLTVNNSLAMALNSKSLIDVIKPIINYEGYNNIFVGNPGSFTHLHSEVTASCAMQLSGIKKWYLIDPKYSHMLNGIPDKNSTFNVSSHGFNLLRSESSNLIPRYETVCESGDFLYVPPWWWHEAQNLTTSVMLSYVPTLGLIPYRTNPMYSFIGFRYPLTFNDYMYPLLVKTNIIDPNEDMVVDSLKVISARLPESLMTD